MNPLGKLLDIALMAVVMFMVPVLFIRAEYGRLQEAAAVRIARGLEDNVQTHQGISRDVYLEYEGRLKSVSPGYSLDIRYTETVAVPADNPPGTLFSFDERPAYRNTVYSGTILECIFEDGGFFPRSGGVFSVRAITENR